MTNAEGARRRRRSRAAAGGVAVVVALLAGGSGTADGAAHGDRPAGDRAWDEIDDYAFTFEYFDGTCDDPSLGAWRITVEDGDAIAAEPLDAAARDSSWDEGAPTLVELHEDALGVRADGAYDTVDIFYVDDGWGRRPAGVHHVDRDDGGYEGCETYTDFRPAG